MASKGKNKSNISKEPEDEGSKTDAATGITVTKKKVDPRIRTLVENGIKSHHRTIFIIIGDKAKNHVVTLFTIMTKAQVKARPSVLWCYKKDLGFTTHRKKREKVLKQKMRKLGQDAVDEDDPFDRFVSTAEIRYTYYRDSHKILGNTFGMCVLQDFEAITPNVLARTIETVEGGGVIAILLENLTSLKQFYTMTMDAHNHYKTDSHREVSPRFNERFILSLSNCSHCLAIDDELNVLPITQHMQQIQPLHSDQKKSNQIPQELINLRESVKDTEPLNSLLKLTKTVDQAKAILTFIGAISEKTLRTTVSLTSGRGRGKSASLGLAISGAITFGYSNIFVTSPSPENLKTLFEFLCKGLESLGYREHVDYELIQSTNPTFNNAIVRVNVFREHRQTVQYLDPHDHHKLGQTELLVVDEAAAIPLPIVKNLLGSYLVFLSSTINGYEGTGRSLSLKLIAQLREQSAKSANSRILQEVDLRDPVRYSSGDPVEKWLNDLLCLDATNVQRISMGYPHPKDCELYYVNRNTLFSYHKASESFLQRMIALFVSSHYKNSPNDLMLMSDAPGHHLFVLLGPVDPKTQKTLPEILCAIQVAMEGNIQQNKVTSVLSGGSDKTPDGDLIPWTMAQQFQDSGFASLQGARVVRIATHPEYQKMGYGSKALELLQQYYQGLIVNLDEEEEISNPSEELPPREEDSGSYSNEIRPRKNLPPLLTHLKDRKPEELEYLGVSFGLTQQLYSFWKKSGFSPVYVRQTQNDLTGEHTSIMLKHLRTDESPANNWLDMFTRDFRKRFVTLLSFAFRNFGISTALSVIDPKRGNEIQFIPDISKEELDRHFTPYDLKRLDSYSRNLLDYHVIIDLLPPIVNWLFLDQVPVSLSAGQCAILLGMGLQRKTLEETADELTLPYDQVRALFNKGMRKFSQYFKSIVEKSIEKSLPYNQLEEKVDSVRKNTSSIETDVQEDWTGDQQPKVNRFDQNNGMLDEAISKLGQNVPKEISVKAQKRKDFSPETPPPPKGNNKNNSRPKNNKKLRKN
eukprot:TRINITY_DN4099_c0_g1_i2.p1 TRINITY_DN4099_c0_g1~~TRINITY_DN4099_c0_g1_i2.p1  ORF type:complete len:1031 (-),score=293.42 TRINITY_DN4099_c0_g1_i2:2-3094(-)